MDEPTIYNRALSSNEIAAIYSAGSAGKCFSPVEPTIVMQPTNQTVFVGGSASFGVTASGTSPLSYQWSLNTTNILGATNATLTLTNIQLPQAGNYVVLVTNVAGTSLSSNAVLSVFTLPPFIASQPSNQVATAGGTATFIVTAGGTLPLNYQWRFNTTNILGATNATLTLTNVQFSQAGNYAVLVTNLYNSILSSNAVLTVNPPPSCDPEPTGLVSWWPGEGNANDIAGTNNGITTSITYANGEVNRAFVFNGSSSNIRVPASPSLNVGLDQGFTIETWINPAASNFQILCEWNQNNGIPSGSTQIGVHFEINETSGDGTFVGNIDDTVGNSHIIYSPAGVITTGNFQHIAMTYDKTTGMGVLYRNGVVVQTANLGSAFTPQTSYDFFMGYRPSGFVSGNYYNGKMDEPSIYNRALSSNEIAAIYNAGSAGKCFMLPTILVQPTNQTVIVGKTATFSVTAGGTSPLSYQWNYNTTNILGATNATLMLTNVQFSQAGNYAVLITNVVGTAPSSNAVLTVNDKLDHFAWGQIPSPRFLNTPFNVVIQALDATNGVFTNFTGTVSLSATTGISITPPVSAAFVQGLWSGSITIFQLATNLVLQANDGNGDSGLANAINIVSQPVLGFTPSGNFLLIYWPVASSNFVLETSGSLAPAQWVPANPPLQIGDQYLESVQMNTTNQFYRLRLTVP
jgi:hypothetical protein